MILTPPRKQRMIEDCQSTLAAIEAMPTFTPCTECWHWEGNTCTHWSATPPADVQPTGCEAWEQGVPF